jgi:hypothetical protein
MRLLSIYYVRCVLSTTIYQYTIPDAHGQTSPQAGSSALRSIIPYISTIEARSQMLDGNHLH